MAAHIVSSICPSCRHAEYTEVKPDNFVAFANDRVCARCGSRYSPPVPWWAGFLGVASGLAGGVLAAWYIRHEMLQSNLGRMPAGGLLLVAASVLLIAFGVKCFLQKQSQQPDSGHGASHAGGVITPPSRDATTFKSFGRSFLKEFALRALFIPMGLGALAGGGITGATLYEGQVPRPEPPAAREGFGAGQQEEEWLNKLSAWNNSQGIAGFAGAAVAVACAFVLWLRIYRACNTSTPQKPSMDGRGREQNPSVDRSGG